MNSAVETTVCIITDDLLQQWGSRARGGLLPLAPMLPVHHLQHGWTYGDFRKLVEETTQIPVVLQQHWCGAKSVSDRSACHPAVSSLLGMGGDCLGGRQVTRQNIQASDIQGISCTPILMNGTDDALDTPLCLPTHRWS